MVQWIGILLNVHVQKCKCSYIFAMCNQHMYMYMYMYMCMYVHVYCTVHVHVHVCGESWLTVKDLNPPSRFSRLGIHFVFVCTVRVWCVGPCFPSFLLFLYDYVSCVVCYTHVFHVHV